MRTGTPGVLGCFPKSMTSQPVVPRDLSLSFNSPQLCNLLPTFGDIALSVWSNSSDAFSVDDTDLNESTFC